MHKQFVVKTFDHIERMQILGYLSSPQSVMTIFFTVPPSCRPQDSITETVSIPSLTCPKTTCLPSSLKENDRNINTWDE